MQRRLYSFGGNARYLETEATKFGTNHLISAANQEDPEGSYLQADFFGAVLIAAQLWGHNYCEKKEGTPLHCSGINTYLLE